MAPDDATARVSNDRVTLTILLLLCKLLSHAQGHAASPDGVAELGTAT